MNTTISHAPVAGAATDCDREPINIPAAIQPHGFLLCLDPDSLTVTQASANLAQRMSVPIENILGMPVIDVIGQRGKARLEQALHHAHLDGAPLFLGTLEAGAGVSGCPGLTIHRYDGVLIAELHDERGTAEGLFGSMYPLVRTFVGSLTNVRSTGELAELAVREVRRITGFGRVMVLSFDDVGHGRVIAEAKAPEYESYLDQHFPATDIPRQAREIYLRNPIRRIVDANYVPVPLVPGVNRSTGRSTDLTFAALRSISPVHLEYMRNMGTLASMSMSIVVRGQLWGLITCHHATAYDVPFEARTACEHIGQILALQIEAKEDHAEAGRRLELRHALVQMLAQMADHEDFVDGLMQARTDLLRLCGAHGAAVVFDGRVMRVGSTPDDDAVRQLVDWLAVRSGHEIFATDALTDLFPAAESYRDTASGLLAVSISQIYRNYVLWFRPEVVRTIEWAGDPRKQGDTHSTVMRLSPRRSFAAWLEVVRGRALPWRPAEVETVGEFRNTMLSIVLRRAEEMAALANELGRANKELEAFSYSVSHDLRAPLRHIVGYGDLLHEYEGAQLSERGRRFLKNIGESARFAGTLVDDLLTFSQMGRAALRLASVDLDALVRGLVKEFESDTLGTQREGPIEWTVHSLPSVTGDAVFLQLALRNLLSNAVKYTRMRSRARIEIRAEDLPDEVVVSIADNGVGFHMDYVGKLFGVFQRLHRLEDFEGTGIGLANVRRIIERHDGRVWARGEPDRGATFHFALPKRPVDAGVPRNPQPDATSRRGGHAPA